jgi:hypothetical protein
VGGTRKLKKKDPPLAMTVMTHTARYTLTHLHTENLCTPDLATFSPCKPPSWIPSSAPSASHHFCHHKEGDFKLLPLGLSYPRTGCGHSAQAPPIWPVHSHLKGTRGGWRAPPTRPIHPRCGGGSKMKNQPGNSGWLSIHDHSQQLFS